MHSATPSVLIHLDSMLWRIKSNPILLSKLIGYITCNNFFYKISVLCGIWKGLVIDYKVFYCNFVFYEEFTNTRWYGAYG